MKKQLFILLILGSIFNIKSITECELKVDMRKLWSDHVLWTREFILAFVENLPIKKATTARLLKNQDDIGDAVGKFYGADAGKELAKLLREHILISAKVVGAAKINNKEELKKQDDIWHENAREIAEFLNKANPDNWPLNDLVEMLNMHLKLTTDEAVSIIKKQWKKSTADFDKVYDEILKMADSLTDGIAAQFPDKVQK